MRFLQIIFISAISALSQTFPGTGSIDDFNRAELGSNYTGSVLSGGGSMSISSNQLTGLDGNSSVYYNASSFGPDCEIYCDITNRAGAFSLFLRLSGTAGSMNGYRLYAHYDYGWVLQRLTNGSPTELLSFSQSFDSGAKIGLSMIGDSLRVYLMPNGGSWGKIQSTIYDATYQSAGYVGIGISNNTATIDNLGGGTISSCSTPIGTNPDAIVDTVGNVVKYADAIQYTGTTADSIKKIGTWPDSMGFTNLTDGIIYYKFKHITATRPCSAAIYNPCGIDTVIVNATGLWDSLVIDSIRPDTGHVGDTGYIYLSQVNKIKNLDSVDFDGTKAALIDTVGDTLSFVFPDKIGRWGVSLCDTVSCSDTDTVVIIAALPPQYIRDTVIVGGHATVAVAPATLTPVDSATACTTSVTAVDEGWRVDSIVHYSGGVRTSAVTYPATQITYFIVANTIDSIFTSEIPAVQYTLTVTDNGAGGTTTPAGAVSVDSGVGTAIQADTATGYRFVRWDTTGVVSIADIYDASTACTLHSGNATVMAIFTDNCVSYSDLGLHADTIIWTDSNHVKVIYTWETEDQLLDWDTTVGTTASIVDGVLNISGGSGDVRGVRWGRHIATTSIRAYVSADSGYLAIYSAIPTTYDGTSWLSDPGIAALWNVAATDFNWMYDGAYTGVSVDGFGTSPYWLTYQLFSDSTRIVKGDTESWIKRDYTNSLDTATTFLLGTAFGKTMTIDSIIIDGIITPTNPCAAIPGVTVVATINPVGGGTVEYNPAAEVDTGDNVTVTFIPADGYKFLGTSGDTLDTARVVSFTNLQSDKAIQGNFVKDSAMILLIKTDNSGTSGDSSFTIPVNAVSADWRWYSGDGFDTSSTLTSYTHKFPQAGIYRVGFIHNSADGFSNPLFNNGGDKLKVLDLQRFGKNRCDALNRSFYGCANMKISARDTIAGATVVSAEYCFFGTGIDTLPRVSLPNCVNFNYFASYCSLLVHIDTLVSPAGQYWNYAFSHVAAMRYFRGVDMHAGIELVGCFRNMVALDSIGPGTNLTSAININNFCSDNKVMTKFAPTTTFNLVTHAATAWDECWAYVPTQNYDWNSLIDASFIWRGCTTIVDVNDSFPVLKDGEEMWVESRNLKTLRIFAPVCTCFRYLTMNSFRLDSVYIVNDSCRDWHFAFTLTDDFGPDPLDTIDHVIESFYVSNQMRQVNLADYLFAYKSIPTETYSQLLDTLAAVAAFDSVHFHGGNSRYFSSSQEARDSLVARGWVLSDSGPVGYTVTATDVGNGTHGFVGDSVSDPGSTVTIYPIPDVGNVFVGYSDDTAGMVLSGDTATFTMSADRSVTLTFEPDTVSLTLTIVGTGSVDTLPSGKGGLFQALELCTLIAVYTPPDTVVTWSGASSGHADTVIITMDTDKSVTATFSSGEGTATRRRIWGGFTPSFGWGWR